MPGTDPEASVSKVGMSRWDVRVRRQPDAPRPNVSLPSEATMRLDAKPLPSRFRGTGTAQRTVPTCQNSLPNRHRQDRSS